MRSSVTSAFSEPDAYRNAMRMEGVADLSVTRPGRFQARITQVTLDHLRLFAVKESLPRIAFISVPNGHALISLHLSGETTQIWGGATARAGNLVVLGPGARVHTRTDGPSHWAGIWFPTDDFARYCQALMGKVPTLPDMVSLWSPPAIASRSLRHILTEVTRVAESRPDVLAMAVAVHSSEQQLIQLLIECLSGQPADENMWLARGLSGVCSS
jgi:AraC-binding-like domain